MATPEQYMPGVQGVHCEEEMSMLVAEKVPAGHGKVVNVDVLVGQ